MITARAFADEAHAVFGLARTGRSIVAALAASGARVQAWDDNQVARDGLGTPGIAIADPMETDLSGLDALSISPGVPLNTHKLPKRAAEAGVPVICDIELFARARPELPPHRVVGITGTNGKSTTTALVHHLLRSAGVPAALGGNIGLPILSQEPLPEGGVYVLELSSYQLDLTHSLDCDVAVLLNLSPDHLDRHGDMAGYARAKARLFDMQSPDHVAIVPGRDPYSREIAAGLKSLRAEADTRLRADQPNWPALAGPHNAANAAAAIAAVRALGLDDDAIRPGLRSFAGLPHRMERVAEHGGVLYVNDSKATNPASAAPALAAFGSTHWIVGGIAKGGDLDPCLPYLPHVRTAYLVGAASDLFAEILAPHVALVRAETVERAVELAAAAAEPGDTVLLSPACASFDQFRDFEERGETFKTAVRALIR